MARMARTQPSGVDFMLARVEFQGKQMHTATGGAVDRATGGAVHRFFLIRWQVDRVL